MYVRLAPLTEQRLERVQDGLKTLSVPFVLDPHLVRGLDYYDNIVFEFCSAIGSVIVVLCKRNES